MHGVEAGGSGGDNAGELIGVGSSCWGMEAKQTQMRLYLPIVRPLTYRTNKKKLYLKPQKVIKIKLLITSK